MGHKSRFFCGFFDKIKNMKELKLIEIIKNTLDDSSFIGDDTAFVENFAITQDTLIEDIHFRKTTITPYELGQKAVAINLSDLAAAGAKPLYILISISLPQTETEKWVEEFYKGINKICKEFDLKVIGGDITGAQKIAISITAIGKAKKHLKRSFAKIGDIICTTGEHGNSKAGLDILEKKLPQNQKFINAHKLPVPKVKEGIKIAEICDMPAVMDTSDGLADALFKIAEASNVTLSVDFAKVPYDKEVSPNAVLFGGEDYELLACVRKEDFEKLKSPLKLYPIGEVISRGDAAVIINFDGRKIEIDKKAIENMSFDHFKKD